MKHRLWYFAQAHCKFPSIYANNFQVMKMCSAFSAIGQGTNLIVPRRLSTNGALGQIETSLWDFYSVPANFEIEWLPFPYPISRFERSTYSIVAALYAVAKRAQLVYTRSGWIAGIVSRLGIFTALEIHEGAHGPAQRLAVQSARSHDNFLALICISQALADRMIEMGFPSDKVLIAHDGVDMQRFKPEFSKTEAREILNIPIDTKVVGYAGHLYEGRGVETLLSVADMMKNTMFILVGGHSTDVARYQGQVEQQGLKNVDLVGFVPHETLPLYLYAADALVMPHTKESPIVQYASPLKMFEYMAAGRPIIASNFPVFREVLHPEVNALLVEPSNPAKLADAIRRVVDDPTLAERLGSRASQDVRAYIWERRAERILDFIEMRYQVGMDR